MNWDFAYLLFIFLIGYIDVISHGKITIFLFKIFYILFIKRFTKGNPYFNSKKDE